MNSTLAIVVPVYNPAVNWEKVLVQRFQELITHIHNTTVSIQIVNDGSTVHVTDDSIAYIKDNIQRVHYYSYTKNKGKGFALRYAMQHITDTHIMYTDVDLPYSLDSMLQVLSQCTTHDIVTGVKHTSYYDQLPLQRKIISRILQKGIKLVFRKLATTDTQCGLKIMNQHAQQAFLNTTIDRYLFDLEFLYAASQNKYKVLTVPVALREGIVFRKMNKKIVFQELYNFIKILAK